MNHSIALFGDLLADFSIRIQAFPLVAKSMQSVDYIELGPGGVSNVAITAARLGMEAFCLGEIGEDIYGQVLRDGLGSEGIDISGLKSFPDSRTPVAGVIVDEAAEPAYVGYPGQFTVREILPEWKEIILKCDAFYTEGWVETEAMAQLNLDALELALEADRLTAFDPGPGNPNVDRAWMREAAEHTRIFIATEAEAKQLTGIDDPMRSARSLLSGECELVVLKRGPAGCVLIREGEEIVSPGFPVPVLDATGAGDSFNAALIYGYLQGYSLEEIGKLANACGAAKVQKLGTGHNVPTVEEIRAVLSQFGEDADHLLPD